MARPPQPDRIAMAGDAARGVITGLEGGREDTLDRSYLLRRGCRFPFPRLLEEPEGFRLRRGRRVSASFSGIRPLARRDPD